MIGIRRMELALAREGGRFRSRVFTPAELEAGDDPAFLASRWAFKEALLKALGTGLSGGATWLDMELPPGERLPAPRVSGATAKMLAGRRIFVSVSVTADRAAALVVLEGKDEGSGAWSTG